MTKPLRDRKGRRIREGDRVLVTIQDKVVVCQVKALHRSTITVDNKGKDTKVSAGSVMLYRRKVEKTVHQPHDFKPGQWVHIKKFKWRGKVNFLVNQTTVSVLVPPQESKASSWQEPVCPVEWLEHTEKPDYL